MEIITTNDGSHSILSEKFGVSYHSTHGAINESLHVFINAGLKYVAINNKDINVLEIGFGTGLNAFLSAIEANKIQKKIHYTGIEAFPVPKNLIDNLNYVELIGDSKHKNIFYDLHQAPWDQRTNITCHFSLQKDLSHFEEISYLNQFDLVFFDAFAPSAQASLWEAALLRKIYKSMKNKAVLVTYCAQGQFKRNLKEVGFHIEALPGPTGKREMTRAIKS